jgi:hypothetical protein
MVSPRENRQAQFSFQLADAVADRFGMSASTDGHDGDDDDDELARIEARLAAEPSTLPQAECYALERWARDKLGRQPVPLREGVGEQYPRRARLQRVVAELALRRGKADEMLQLALPAWWSSGESASRIVELFLTSGWREHAAVAARLSLARAECPAGERVRLHDLLDEIDEVPGGWRDALQAFVAEPTRETWKAITRFSHDNDYERLRNATRSLLDLGADPNALFAYATEEGITVDAVEMVERGLVDTDVVIERGRRAAPLAQGLWLALAARAALAHRDDLGVVRLLKAAFAHQPALLSPLLDAAFIRDAAGDELNALLDAAGIPDPRKE